MKFSKCLLLSAFAGAAAVLQAEVPELLEVVPDAKGYELIAKFNPLKYSSEGYITDNVEEITGDLKKVGYLVKLSDKQDQKTFVFVSMDPFASDLGGNIVPTANGKIYQQYVNNLEVVSNVPSVKAGKFEKGNIEFWGLSYGGGNALNIPGATGAFDFGDAVTNDGGYGSMQVHNYLEKQTVFSFSNLNAGSNCDLGIGNCPTGSNPDWTFSKSGNNYNKAEIYVVGKFDNYKFTPVAKLDPAKVTFNGTINKSTASYAPGEEIIFTIKTDFAGQDALANGYKLNWVRTGDDGKTEKGSAVATEPVVVKTAMDTPGFVRFRAFLADRNGRTVTKNNNGKFEDVVFDGGAGVDVDKLVQAVPEPADFDAFWAKQKALLDQVPLKYKMNKINTVNGVDIYEVSVDCAGSRPVTGYLTIPVNAADKSLKANVEYQGYGVPVAKAPGNPPSNRINFYVNAHGYDLSQPQEYYIKYAESIKFNNQGYAFDKAQNADPEKAYFRDMALRVMRSLQFVKSLPQWNGKDLSAAGGSQGGLQCIWAGGLDPDVSSVYSNVTWCCDFGGPTKGRLGGWRPEYIEGLNYYDAVNHAKRIKCYTEITRAGLGDYVCPPSGVTILYNNLKVPKKIIYFQGSTHGFVPKDPQKFVVEQK